MITSLESLPLRIYSQILKTSKYELLGDGTVEQQIAAWDNICKEYFELFGFGAESTEKILLEIEYVNLMRDYYLNNNKRAKTMANITLERIKMGTNSQETSFLEACVNLSIALQTPVDYHKITVAEFYYYIKAVEQKNKALKSK